MYILGINAYHGDSSASLIKDGRLIAAIEEERINRVKHWSGLPIESIRFCLSEAKISLNEVQYITVSKNTKAKIFNKLLYATVNPRLFLSVKNRAQNALIVSNILTNLGQLLAVKANTKSNTSVHFIEHHRSHNASSFFYSNMEESALLSIDGMGDFTSTMLGYGSDTRIKVLDTIGYPHSLGYLYTAMTQFLGFKNFGDEYKVMGLASYGSPDYARELKQMINRNRNGFFRLYEKYFSHFESGVKMDWNLGSPVIGDMFSSAWVSVFGPPRDPEERINQHHMNLAASVQLVTEEIIFSLCEAVYKKTKSENLCLSGGVAQNSVANGKILQNSPFKRLYVPPASHDAGTAIGSSLYFYHHDLGMPRIAHENGAYSGPKYSNEDIKAILSARGASFLELDESKIYQFVVKALNDGQVVGWFQGRAEFGPRALGNRSILVDPRNPHARQLLNQKIKKREDFRPFASSVLQEKVADFFDCSSDSFYMEKVFKVKTDKRGLIPAVTHADGSSRVQTVSEIHNPRFHKLISHFYNRTDIPLLLNTSFNENEPIVNSPEHTLECFTRTEMDLLVMENIVIPR